MIEGFRMFIGRL